MTIPPGELDSPFVAWEPATVIGPIKALQINAGSWPNTYLPGIGAANAVSDYVIGPTTAFYALRATAFRTSDNPSVGAQNLLNSVNLVVTDHLSRADAVWNHYSEGIIPSNGKYATFFNEESSIANFAAAATVMDPFTTGVAQLGAIVNLRLDSGIATPSNTISAYLDMVNNGGNAHTAIRVASDALDIASGYAGALSMATAHGVEWYAAATVKSWRMFANVGTAHKQGDIILGDGTFDLFLGPSNVHALAVTTTNVTFGISLTGPDGSVWSSAGLNLISNVLQLGSVNALSRNSGTGALTISTNGGNISVAPNTGITTLNGIVVPALLTVASLNSTYPASTALKGARGTVSDATAPTFLGTLTGGGAVVCPVFCNGAAWVAG